MARANASTITTADGPETFGLLLRQYRMAAGLSQNELGERAGLSRRGISDLERGVRRAPYPATARRLAEGLRLDATERAAFLSSAFAFVNSLGTSHSAGGAGANQPGTDDRSSCAATGSDSRHAVPHNLPLQVASFIGRERERADLQRLLGSARLITLTGVGGVGKTRLALRVAGSLVDQYPNGVWFVDLAPLASHAAVASTVALAVGVTELPGRPVLRGLVEALGGVRTLLVLDNCEHVAQACADLAQILLSACPGVWVLATSREPLGVAGETIWRVPPL